MIHTGHGTRCFTREIAVLIRPLIVTLFAALILSSAVASARQDEPPRRPQGPATSPIIKLPRGAGAESQTPEQQQPERRSTAQRKWEYCAIVGFVIKERSIYTPSSPRTPWAVIRYFPNNREEIEGANEEDALANAFAKLGDEGWEMTGVRETLKLNEGNGETRHVYYFKRPKRDE